MSKLWINAEDIPDDDFLDLSQTSNQSQFRLDEDLDDDSEYLPSSYDQSSQEFSQVISADWDAQHVYLSLKRSLVYIWKDLFWNY